MKLYTTVCWGLLVVFLCDTPKPAVVSDFCQQTEKEIAALQRFSHAEAIALTRPRRDAINSLKRKYQRLCE